MTAGIPIGFLAKAARGQGSSANPLEGHRILGVDNTYIAAAQV